MDEIEIFFKRKRLTFVPFESILIEFCDTLSKNLFAREEAKAFPDIAALAFWLRKSHIEELKTSFITQQERGLFLVPRGSAFHIAPANVETMFVYSWILSLLVGNGNIVRLPTKDNENLTLLFEEIQKVLHMELFKDILETTCLLAYGHEETITASISARADVRIIWGGDETIRTIRKIPLKVSAKEIIFADRFAFSTIEAEAFLTASDEERLQVIKNLYNDIFWYDQNACSSPRALFWIGSQDTIKQSSEIAYKLLQKVILEKKYMLPLGLALQKETYVYSMAMEIDIKDVKRFSNEFTVIKLERFYSKCREHCGSGLLYHIDIQDLNEMAEYLTLQDQTLTYYGVSREKIKELVRSLNGKGLDRIVPIGQALHFDPFWDGYNLLLELTKYVHIV